MAWVRSAGLRGVRAVVEELGGDADELAIRCGLPVESLDSDELLVRDSAMATLLQVAAATLDSPDFGLRVAQRQDLDLLGPLAIAVRHSASIAEALDCTSKYLFVHARGLSVDLVPDPRGDSAVVGCRYGYPPGIPTPPQSIDMGLLFLHRTLLNLNDGPYGLRSVDIPHPATAPLSRYEGHFGVRVTANCAAAVLRVPRSLGQRPIAGGDRATRQLALAHLQEHRDSPDLTVTTRVRTLLRQSLGTTHLDLDGTASLLGMSPRSLQRHLRLEGDTRYGCILDEVRQERAAALLTDTRLPMTQIAAAIGLNNQATLSRYAQRWWNTTPLLIRRDGPP